MRAASSPLCSGERQLKQQQQGCLQGEHRGGLLLRKGRHLLAPTCQRSRQIFVSNSTRECGWALPIALGGTTSKRSPQGVSAAAIDLCLVHSVYMRLCVGSVRPGQRHAQESTETNSGKQIVDYGLIWGHFQSSSLGHLSLLSIPLYGRARRLGKSAACAFFGSMLSCQGQLLIGRTCMLRMCTCYSRAHKSTDKVAES